MSAQYHTTGVIGQEGILLESLRSLVSYPAPLPRATKELQPVPGPSPQVPTVGSSGQDGSYLGHSAAHPECPSRGLPAGSILLKVTSRHLYSQSLRWLSSRSETSWSLYHGRQRTQLFPLSSPFSLLQPPRRSCCSFNMPGVLRPLPLLSPLPGKFFLSPAALSLPHPFSQFCTQSPQ